MSFLCWGFQSWMQYSRQGRRRRRLSAFWKKVLSSRSREEEPS